MSHFALEGRCAGARADTWARATHPWSQLGKHQRRPLRLRAPRKRFAKEGTRAGSRAQGRETRWLASLSPSCERRRGTCPPGHCGEYRDEGAERERRVTARRRVEVEKVHPTTARRASDLSEHLVERVDEAPHSEEVHRPTGMAAPPSWMTGATSRSASTRGAATRLRRGTRGGPPGACGGRQAR